MSDEVTKTKGLCIATRCRNIDEFVSRFHPFCDDASIFVATLSGRAVGVESQFVIMLRNKTPALRGWCRVLDSWSDAANPFGRPGIRLALDRLSTGSQVVLSRMHAARKANGVPPVASTSKPIARPRAPTVEAMPLDLRTARQLTVRIPAIGRETAPLRLVESAIAVAGAGVVVEARSGVERRRPNPRAMTAPLRGSVPDGVVTHELDEPTERMTMPPIMAPALGSAPVPLGPLTHHAVRQITAAGMIEPRAPGSKLVLPANPLMNLSDESLGGFVDCRLDELLGTVGAPEPAAAPTEEIARGSSDRHAAIRDSLESEHTAVVSRLPPPRQSNGVPWLLALAGFAAAIAIGFTATYLVTMLR